MEFLQRFFRRDSYFKKLHKVLAAYLRNTLVHGFGFSKIEMSPPRYIDLCINKPASVQLQACKKDGERVLKLNSISLACQTIEAFDRLKKKVEEGDTDLCATILEALEYIHPVSERVLHQFDKVYEEAQRKGAACPA